MKLTKDLFVSPEDFEKKKFRLLAGPNGWLQFVACDAGHDLARSVKTEYEQMLAKKHSALAEIPLCGGRGEASIIIHHEDGETVPRLPCHVAGSDAYVFQNLSSRLPGDGNPNDNLWQLIQVIRTLRDHRAKTITAVIPYFPGRQDKPTFGQREATLSRLAADELIEAGMDQALTYHLHNDAILGFFEPTSIIGLTGLHYFLHMFKEFKGRDKVIAVPTDAGGAKYTAMLARGLGIDYAMAGKSRNNGTSTDLLGIVGDFSRKNTALVCDDESVTGGSLIAVVRKLHDAYGLETHAAISHNKISPEAINALIEAHEKFGLRTLHVTDSIPQTGELLGLPFIKMHSLTSQWVYAVNRLHYNQSLKDVFLRK